MQRMSSSASGRIAVSHSCSACLLEVVLPPTKSLSLLFSLLSPFLPPLLPFSFSSFFFHPALNNYDMNGRTLRVDFAENSSSEKTSAGIYII